jgi:hypothetical protein
MLIQHCSAQELAAGLVVEADVVVAMPATDLPQAELAAGLMGRRAGAPGVILIVHDADRQGYMATCNQAFAQSRGEYFCYVAQDAFAGRLWLKVAQNMMLKTGKNMLAFNDGKWHGLLASFGMVKRAWAQQHYNGALFHPSYHTHFGDAELTLLARAHDQICYAPRSVMIEVDWGKDDKLAHDLDRAVFQQRAKTLFEAAVSSEADCVIFPVHKPATPQQ